MLRRSEGSSADAVPDDQVGDLALRVAALLAHSQAANQNCKTALLEQRVGELERSNVELRAELHAMRAELQHANGYKYYS